MHTPPCFRTPFADLFGAVVQHRTSGRSVHACSPLSFRSFIFRPSCSLILSSAPPPWPRLIPRLGLPRSAARLALRDCIVRESGSAAASSDPRRLSHRLLLHVFIMPGTLFFRKASVCSFFCPSRRLIALSSSISITSPHGLFVSLRRLLSFLALLVVCACALALLRPPPIASCFAFYFLFATPRCSAPPTLFMGTLAVSH